jgi:nickel-dependent lactate racemase
VRFLNHAWSDAEQLAHIGTIDEAQIAHLTENRFAQSVPVEVNRAVFDYDHLLLVGPVFPHEVAGFSGGNKYLFPGVSGPQVLNFFHWLGAVVTSPGTIGIKQTAVRRVIDHAANRVSVPRTAVCMVVRPGDGGLAGLWVGETDSAWNLSADLSARVHVVYKPQPFHTVLAVAPPMYDDIWVAGKCMYKLEPVVADGGELIIYAPHVSEVSVTHGKAIARIGYHTRDYFLAQWDKFQHEPWGVLAHSTHVKGIGTYENGVEKPRVRVTLATAIPPETCQQINLGYRDPNSLNLADFQNRENEGVLFVGKAGEMLYRLGSKE